MRKILSVMCFFCQLSALAQLQESFADGELRQHPAWLGDLEFFQVNPAGQLQSKGPALTPTILQVATACQAVTATTWEFYARLNLATSSANYADIFLMSDSARLQGSNQGYFIRLGGSPDEVSLFRKDGPASAAYVINGRDGTLNKATGNVVRVKVHRDMESKWTLWLDLSGTGTQFAEEGSATDARYQRSAFMGLLLRYSAANSGRFFFDDFAVTDLVAPTIRQLEPTGPRQLALQFNEPVVLGPAAAGQQFWVSNGTGPATRAEADTWDPSLIRLDFSHDFTPGASQLTVSQTEDVFGNQVTDLKAGFIFTPPVVAQYREVRINEILANDDPAVGLPEAEFVELYNSSTKIFDLKNWKYSDATLATAILPAYQLLPGAFVILCRAADTLAFKSYGPVLGLSAFPALNDGGDVVELLDAQDKLIDRLAFTPDWYRDAGKANGGWSLELVNPAAICGNAENVKASIHPAGGTPGQQNSVYDTTPDSQPPVLLRVSIIHDKQLRLTFSEALDSLAALAPAHYLLSPAVPIARVSVLAPAYQEVVLDLQEALQVRQLYTFGVEQLRDCAGNVLSSVTLPLALPEPAAPGEVVINEVLFNPRPGGVDFVELVNRSPKFIDLANWQLASIRPGAAADPQLLSREPFILAPQQYLVLTTRPDLIRQHYIHSQQSAFLILPQLPAYPDEAGTVLLQDPTGMPIDQFSYHEDMHFALLDDPNGVSLERIRLAGDSSRANWHSAASTVGFATPGYRNSQHYEAINGTGVFTVEPRAFTPDGDGDRDFATINYQPEVNGFMASITIFDAEGREIRRLVKNQLLAMKGFFQWDGLNERGQKAAIGYYVLFIELFNPGGAVKIYRETVALGARF